MGLPLHLSIKLGTHLLKMKLRRVEKFPMIVEIEPLFACNLKCVGCGKIQHPASELKRRMPVEQAVAAVEECGAPMVSIAGGEPLMHPQVHEIVNEISVKRRKFVVLCTNAVLLPKYLHKFTPSKNFAWMVHIDGLRERHDESVSKEGVFDQAVAAIKLAEEAGFQVYTNSTFFNTDSPQTVIDVLNYLNDELKGRPDGDLTRLRLREGPGPGQVPRRGADPRTIRRRLRGGAQEEVAAEPFAAVPGLPRGKKDFACTPWGVPSYSLFGWQRPCYLLADGYAKTYAELLDTTEWEKFGRGKDPRCDNCMAHCGYEPSAVLATMCRCGRASAPPCPSDLRLGAALAPARRLDAETERLSSTTSRITSSSRPESPVAASRTRLFSSGSRSGSNTRHPHRVTR